MTTSSTEQGNGPVMDVLVRSQGGGYATTPPGPVNKYSNLGGTAEERHGEKRMHEVRTKAFSS